MVGAASHALDRERVADEAERTKEPPAWPSPPAEELSALSRSPPPPPPACCPEPDTVRDARSEFKLLLWELWEPRKAPGGGGGGGAGGGPAACAARGGGE